MVQFSAGMKYFFLVQNMQVSSGSHQVVTEPSLRGVKQLGREAGHSLASSAKAEKEWVPFMYLHGVYMEGFYSLSC